MYARVRPADSRCKRAPEVEVAARIAQALGVSLDFLTGLTDRELDSEVIGLMDGLHGLEKDEQSHIIKTL